MEGKQLSTFVIALVSLIITTIFVAVRCVVRINIRGFGLDDYSMALGQVCSFFPSVFHSLQCLVSAVLANGTMMIRYCSLAPVSPSCGDVDKASA
jgi:hypothetical protein